MKIYDQHLHTFLSSDSDELFENYLQRAEEQGATHFVSTEHLDLSCFSFGGDDVPDLLLQRDIINDLQEKYAIRILRGIEIGYKFSRLNDIEDIVKAEDFDVVVMSIHESEAEHCLSAAFLDNKKPSDLYNEYLDLYINMLENCSCFDIVGHVDFILRYIGAVDIVSHEEKLKIVLNMIIKLDKCLEFNTRFLYQYSDDFYLRYIFNLYYELGGRKVSLGSDAHSAQDYFGSFDFALEILREIGFTYICVYQGRVETKLTI